MLLQHRFPLLTIEGEEWQQRQRPRGPRPAKAGKAAASTLRTNPYVQRLIEDPELRDNVRAAVDHARKAYKRMSNGKGPAKALMEDRKLQQGAAQAPPTRCKEAGDQLRGKRRKHRGRKLLMLVVISARAAFLIVNEGARKALLDKMFGAEEEFEYTSTTSPSVAHSRGTHRGRLPRRPRCFRGPTVV